MLIPIEIATFALDPGTNLPVVVLKETSGNRTLMVTLDQFEARTIALNSLDVNQELPHTIDLARLIVEKMGGKFEKIILEDRDGGLCANLSIRHGKQTNHWTCRVSDGIALALRCNLSLLVPESLLIKACPEQDLTQAQKLGRTIAAIDTLRFGEFIIE
ncbi:MAG: DUF151 domain-containing protein [Chitinivibrionales bacterium]|nr:DUF151 domain-containing protein [Chitinivibrionales bacterium]